MKSLLLVLACSLTLGCASNRKTTPVYLYQTVKAETCEMAETGNFDGRPMHSYVGKVREMDPQVYECAIEIPLQEFEKKLGYCTMRGHNYAAGYEFFQGNPNTRRHGCDARPLKNGNFYFSAIGIDNDSCDWICFPEKNE
jgi:hypothetical protein